MYVFAYVHMYVYMCVHLCMYVYVTFLLYQVPNSGFDTSTVDLISSVNLFFMLGVYKMYINEC